MNIAHHAAFLRKKSQVSHQFSRAATSYDEAATIQQQALSTLIELLAEHTPDGHWLDIGCGTGKAFAPLQETGVQTLTGIDLSSGMLDVAASRAGNNITLIQADADNLPIGNQQCDGILSSLMLQWSQNIEATLVEWARTLKPGGRLAIATLLPGTHAELAQAWANVDDHVHVNPFDHRERLNKAITNAGLTIQTQHQASLKEHYPSLPELLRSLKAIGATNVNPGRQPGLMTRKTLQQLALHYPRTTQPGDAQPCLPLTYEVCWIIATYTGQPEQ